MQSDPPVSSETKAKRKEDTHVHNQSLQKVRHKIVERHYHTKC